MGAATLSLLPATAWAETYWVDQNASNASDNNPGSESQPWETLVKALNTAEAGDTIKVHEGSYSGINSASNSDSQKQYRGLSFANNGTAVNPIVVEAVEPGKTIIDQNYNASGFLIDGSQHIEIKGLVITRAYGGGVHVRRGNNITVHNNYIHNIDGPPGSNVGGIRFDKCESCTATNNTIHDVRVNGTHTEYKDGGNSAAIHSYGMSYGLISRNRLYNSYNGFYHKESAGVKGADVSSNIIHDVTIGFAYSVKGSGSPQHVDQVINNNVLFNATDSVFVWAHDAADWNTGFRIFNNTFESAKKGIWLEATKDARVERNIFADQTSYVIAVAATNGDRPGELDVSDHNCFYNAKQFGKHPNKTSTFYTSLSQWTSATGLDQNSTALSKLPFESNLYRTKKPDSGCPANVGADIESSVGASFLTSPVKALESVNLRKL